MTFVSLFAGIGGIDLGLERAGHECVGQVEIDPYARKVLKKHWPDTPRIADVKDFHGSEFGPFDLLTGGYPCQPFSIAGRRGGDTDERHLWPEVHRVIRNVRPKHILLENVPGHLSLGFGRVLGDLAESGYDAEWDCIPAAAVGAPHLRDRVFIVAHAREQRPNTGKPDSVGGLVPHVFGHDPQPQTRRSKLEPWTGRSGQMAYAKRSGLEGGSRSRGEGARRAPVLFAGLGEGRGRQWFVEPNVGRVANGVPNRVDRLRTLGNSVVPQVAEWIGRRLA